VTEDGGWIRDRLFQQAAQLGAQEERQRSLGDSVSHLRTELKDGLISIRTEMSSQYNHMRGEIVALRDEERRRADDLIEQLEQNAERARRLNRLLMVGAGAIIVGGQQVLDHLPQILNLLGP
jgi:hypothetical protein